MTRSNIIVISGTGMDVGKSTLTKAICRVLVAQKMDVVAIKPTETWCGHGPPSTEDGFKLASVTGQTEPRFALRRYSPIGAPPVAAEIEGKTIEWEPLIEDVRKHARAHEIALVETMGGICTPINWEHDYLDLTKELGAPVLLVGQEKAQGAATALLAMRAIRSVNVEVLGVALTVPAQRDGTTGSNANLVRRYSGLQNTTMVPNVRIDTPNAAYHDDLSLEMMGLEEVKTIAGWMVQHLRSR